MRYLLCACLIVAIAACEGSGGTPTPDGFDVTLSDDGCTATPREFAAGAVALSIENESSSIANFELLRLEASFEQLAQFLADARERIDAGEDPPGDLPGIAEEADRELVAAGLTGELAADLSPGTYAVVCVVLDEQEDIVTAYAVGPYTVSD